MPDTPRRRPLRGLLWDAQGGACWICGDLMEGRGNQARSATLDHLWPRSRVGRLGAFGTCLLAHRDCNQARGAALPTEEHLRVLVSVYRRLPESALETQLRAVSQSLEPYRALIRQERLLTEYLPPPGGRLATPAER